MDFIKNDKWFPVNSESKPFTIDDKAGNALLLRGRRLEVIAANMANADTPNYKARDFDFQAALEEANAATEPVALVTNSPLHMAATASESPSSSMLYRIPYQPSLDGNTVEMAVEQAAFTENRIRYEYELQEAGDETKDVLDLFKSLK
jgi:flagellar basal-body rod protein FlgB